MRKRLRKFLALLLSLALFSAPASAAKVPTLAKAPLKSAPKATRFEQFYGVPVGEEGSITPGTPLPLPAPPPNKRRLDPAKAAEIKAKIATNEHCPSYETGVETVQIVIDGECPVFQSTPYSFADAEWSDLGAWGMMVPLVEAMDLLAERHGGRYTVLPDPQNRVTWLKTDGVLVGFVHGVDAMSSWAWWDGASYWSLPAQEVNGAVYVPLEMLFGFFGIWVEYVYEDDTLKRVTLSLDSSGLFDAGLTPQSSSQIHGGYGGDWYRYFAGKWAYDTWGPDFIRQLIVQGITDQPPIMEASQQAL